MGLQVIQGFVFLGLSGLIQSQQQTLPPPVRVASSITQPNGLTACAPLNFSAHRETIQQGVQDYYQSDSTPSTYDVSSCPCGGSGGWTRAVYLDMSDMNQQCPNNLTLITTPVRGCGRTNPNSIVCDSVTYPVHGLTYSRVCGRILAYQRGMLSAFFTSIARPNNNIELPYLTGVSLTHGQPGSRQHIWSFVGGFYEVDNGLNSLEKCPCSVSNYPYTIPSFINNNYFCDSGNLGPNYSGATYYTEDPLWDGHGCGTGSTCCELNNPPWFCTSLPQPTSDDLEIRSCIEGPTGNGELIINLMDIYIK